VKPLLVQHSLSLNLKRNPAIRRQVNLIEDLVKDESEGRFAQPQVVPVPDELDPSVPRLIFVSKAGFSQLLISQVSVNFNVSYSPDWGLDPGKCEDYLRSKVDFLFKLAEAGWDFAQKPLFVGVTTNFRVPAADQADSVARLAQLFVESAMLAENANELSYRCSLSLEDHFYSNISVSTQVSLKAQAAAGFDGIPRFSPDTIEGYGIEVVGDYNDRLAYNFDENYRSSRETVDRMIGLGCRSAIDAVGKIR
jgi:hypothetical protein